MLLFTFTVLSIRKFQTYQISGDLTLIWYSTTPDFTPCFQNTVLMWIPCVFLWVFSPVELLFLVRSRKQKVPWTWINATKSLLTGLLVCLSLVELIHGIVLYTSEEEVYPVDYYTPFIKFVTFLLAFLFICFGVKKGMHTSGVLFMFWLFLLIGSFIQYRSILLRTFDQETNYAKLESTFNFVVAMIFFPVVVSLFFFSCFADKKTTVPAFDQVCKKVCPEEKASFLSKITFWWFTGLTILGYKKPLVKSEMWNLSPENESGKLVKDFDRHWIPGLEKAFSKDNEASRYSNVNILGPVIKTFAPELVVAALLKLVGSVTVFVNPLVLDLVISFVSGNEPFWKGFFYAGLMLFASIIESLFNNQYEYCISLTAMRMRSCIISTIYKKSLQLSNDAKRQFTVGEIVNLMAVDTQRIMEFVIMMNLIWSAPLQIGISLWLLWGHLGVSTLGGVIMIILLLPINGFISAKMKIVQQRLMKEKDKRIKMMNEILGGIKVIKLYAWEEPFRDSVKKYRAKEIHCLTVQAYLAAFIVFIFTCAPFLIGLASFTMYILIDSKNILDSNKAFVSLSLFNILRGPLAFLPRLITFAALFIVSLKRINKFLRSAELDPNDISHDAHEKSALIMQHASFSWERKSHSVLKDICVQIKPGNLVAVVGQVGSGKSSFLSAFLGDMKKIKGFVNVKGSVAYVPQQAWIQNATLRKNILFGKELDQTKYNKVLDSTALIPDLEILPGSDLTEIGEKGINLSGGQKQRVSLARAVYSEADIFLLDDPLSAVDSHVGKHIFDQVIGPSGLLKHKTRVLITHKVSILPQVDTILVFRDGHLTENGSFTELLNKKGAFSEFLVQYFTENVEEEDEILPDKLEIMEQLVATVGPSQELQRLSSRSGESAEEKEHKDRSSSIDSDLKHWHKDRSPSIDSHLRHQHKDRSPSIDSDLRRRHSKQEEEQSQKGQRQTKGGAKNHGGHSRLIQSEAAEIGSVQWSVYFAYVKAIGLYGVGITLVSYALSQAFNLGTNLWLSEWSNDAADPEKATDQKLRNLRLGVYGALGGGETVFIFIATLVLNLATLHGSEILHDDMLNRIILCPMSFFDTTPIGRILNRFSRDVDTNDLLIRFNVRMLLVQVFRASVAFIAICLETPLILIVMIPLGGLYYLIQRFYIPTTRQLRRLESISRSPIYTHFSETITGTSSIRAYGVTKQFIEESNRRVDVNHTCYFPSVVANRWLSVRLEFLGYCIVFFSALFAVLTRETLSPGLVGLSVSYALTITGNLNMLVKASTGLETNIVAVERCLEYSQIPTEAGWHINSTVPDDSWPAKGNIHMESYTTRYRQGLDLVLHGITCDIQSGEKIGIVGRTGAGKSSLILSLFRIIEAVDGFITIDGVNIASIGLHDLRAKLTVIPQDPVLFTGTLRINLDPLNKHTDDELWKVLELSHLKSYVSSLDGALEYQVAEGGDNLSVGQRQLVCLARALLRKTKILVLDEATAAVDLETDDFLQSAIRKEFKDSTVLTIAHRLNTILDYDRIMVLERGKIVEFDSPNQLLNDSNTKFYAMAKDAGLV
ncbi:multidrug resistance-associated protein 1-like isoform X3 [Tachypleus tridentatus]|uniref:multidrug resistance-associated protein 1-like isoform X3 n=1 Tax=Tachypleus tridentatus TaxID=6853 RepID=UPI003FD52DFF